MWLSDPDREYQVLNRRETNFGMSDSSSFNYSFGYGDTGLTSDFGSTVTSNGFAKTTDEQSQFSVLNDGSDEIGNDKNTESFKYNLESIDGGPVTGSSTSTVETRYRINAGGWGQDSYETASVSYPLSDAEAETDASDPARSTESILEEYRDRSEQVARLKAMIANPDTDPGMIDYYQDLLDDENNILADLTTEATDAGADKGVRSLFRVQLMC